MCSRWGTDNLDVLDRLRYPEEYDEADRLEMEILRAQIQRGEEEIRRIEKQEVESAEAMNEEIRMLRQKLKARI